jgi:DNA-binding NarL/FixJ family response regulator
MIRLIIADDHHLVRQGIRRLLDDIEGMEVIGEAATGQEAVDLVQQLKPDVALIDIAMPRMDGSQAAERIHSLGLNTQVIILSMYSDPLLAQQLLRLGIRGYLLKASLAEELPLAIRAASQGQLYLSPAISDMLLTSVIGEPGSKLPESPGALLTSREREVLQLVAEGYTNNAIAETLSISVKTVEKHRANIMIKLDAHDLPTLIRKAMKYGLIFPDA